MDIPRRRTLPSEEIDISNVDVDPSGKIGHYALGGSSEERTYALRWALNANNLSTDTRSIEKHFVQHVEYSLAQTRSNMTPESGFKALAMSMRDRLVERWKDTQIYFYEKDVKRVAYMSLEFLVGRSLTNAMSNLGVADNVKEAMRNLGMDLEEISSAETDAGLGNGGLGRLAACFMDSMATLDIPAWGYGLRYTYGMFLQAIRDGWQVEMPDYWLTHGNPWEIERLDVSYMVGFYGSVSEEDVGDGKKKHTWEPAQHVVAIAYDTPVPGYGTFNTLNIRLWSAAPSKEFDLEFFNKGDFFKSMEDRVRSEQITHVLYPDDSTEQGRLLRLKQQYFFVSATLQDLLRRFKRRNRPFTELPSKLAIQLNDTHPSLGIPELMRLLIDQEGLEWDVAWPIVHETFGYTNHTVLPEALERWPVSDMEKLLPRHIQIIYEINHRFLQQVNLQYPGDMDRIRSLSIIQEGDNRMVRMANLAIVGSHSVNGVAAIHSGLLKTNVFPEFYQMWPGKFQNKTNGVTPRRWVQQANPQLGDTITLFLQTDDWLHDLSLLSGLRQFADEPTAQEQFAEVKRFNKMRLARLLRETNGLNVNIGALFDIQVKRIHEYKRQLMNILFVIYRYRTLKQMSDEEKDNVVPRVVVIAGKSAPAYTQAKLIIKLINSVAEVVNNDPEIGDLLKVAFMPNYCVSLAETIIPASDISQHISTAGLEASGTSNMKFVMNGGLILGTLDGANIEICEEVGAENMFVFGARTSEIHSLREQLRSGSYQVDPRFNQALGMIAVGTFGNPTTFQAILNSMTKDNDYYLLSVDFKDYLRAQDEVDKAYMDRSRWMSMAIRNIAGSGKFSSDRTIDEYARDIWDVKPCRRPGPAPVSLQRLSSAGLVTNDQIELSSSPNSSPHFLFLERKHSDVSFTRKRAIGRRTFTQGNDSD